MIPSGTVVAYVVVGATGYRVFTDMNGVSSVSQISDLNGGTAAGATADGGDNILYQAAPYVDYAGITFTMSQVPQWPNSNDPSVAPSLQFNYLNLWTNLQLNNGKMYAIEAVLTGTPNNMLSISFSPYNGSNQQTCNGYTTTGLPATSNSTSNTTVTTVTITNNSNLSGGNIAAVVICTIIGAVLCLICGICIMYAYTRDNDANRKAESNSINNPAAAKGTSYQSSNELSQLDSKTKSTV